MIATAFEAAIDAALPQMQCGQCGHPACAPYAAAIAAGAPLNACTPGGAALVRRLAEITGRNAEMPPDDLAPAPVRQIAIVDEVRCIGCTLCIRACPIDAIVGAAKWMHGVIDDECSGCGLCLPPCPVDCIDLRPAPDQPWSTRHAHRARRRYETRRQRDAKERQAKDSLAGDLDADNAPHRAEERRRRIELALATAAGLTLTAHRGNGKQ